MKKQTPDDRLAEALFDAEVFADSALGELTLAAQNLQRVKKEARLMRMRLAKQLKRGQKP